MMLQMEEDLFCAASCGVCTISNDNLSCIETLRKVPILQICVLCYGQNAQLWKHLGMKL